jgi:hypothetical protein
MGSMTHAVESFLIISVKQHVMISGCDDTEIRDIQEVHRGRGLSLLDRDDARHGSVTIRSFFFKFIFFYMYMETNEKKNTIIKISYLL